MAPGVLFLLPFFLSMAAQSTLTAFNVPYLMMSRRSSNSFAVLDFAMAYGRFEAVMWLYVDLSLLEVGR